MSKQANPTVIGGFVLVAIALAVAMIVVLGGGALGKETNEYVSFFQGKLDGVRIGSSVTFNGIKTPRLRSQPG